MLINLRNKVDIPREFIFPIIIIFLIIIKRDSTFFLKIFFPFYVPLTLLGNMRKLLTDVVNEKYFRYKETLKIMGLTQLSYTTSNLLTFYTIGLGIEAVIIIILCSFEIVKPHLS